jgi:hypothetical protein
MTHPGGQACQQMWAGDLPAEVAAASTPRCMLVFSNCAASSVVERAVSTETSTRVSHDVTSERHISMNGATFVPDDHSKNIVDRSTLFHNDQMALKHGQLGCS